MMQPFDGLARLRRVNPAASRGWLEFGCLRLPAAIGRGGLRHRKREGDGGTPSALLALRAVYYRADRMRRPLTPVPTRPLQPDDGWCDAAGDRNYNRPVTRPYRASSEPLWRADALYDIVGVLDYNIVPRRQGFGSAIFLHVARPDLAPTDGCIALHRDDLLQLLEARVPLMGIDTRPWRGTAA